MLDILKCESWIEEKFLDALKHYVQWLIQKGWIVDQQHRVPGARAKIDFTLVRGDWKFAIELDGHPFHEKTVLQSTRDKRRDRALTAEGWRVLRFTGAEVFENPADCASQLLDIMEKLGAIVGGVERATLAAQPPGPPTIGPHTAKQQKEIT